MAYKPTGRPVGTNQNANKYAPSDAANPFGASNNSKYLAITRNQPERDIQAMELRSKGYTYEQIAATMGIAKETARLAVDRQLQRLADDLRHAAAKVRELEDVRMDDMIARTSEKLEEIMDPDSGLDIEKQIMLMVKMHDSMIRIMERRAKMFGLDAPVKAELEHSAKKTISHAEMIAALADEIVETTGRTIEHKPEERDDDNG